MKQEKQRPKIGIAAWIFNEKNQVLLGKRKGAHGSDSWATPGGHLELGETPEFCAERETLEETGLEIKDVYPIGFTNDIFNEDKHYITLHMESKISEGNPKVMEPEKCECWEWFDLNNLPEPLFAPIINLMKQEIDLNNS